MKVRQFFFLVSALVLMPAAASGQVAEEHEGEAGKAVAKPAAGGKPPDLAEVAVIIVRRTNEFRKAEGRGAVTVNPMLAETARSFAAFMAETDKYGHHADGRRPADRAKEQGYDYCIVSENIAYQFNSAGFTTGELAGGFFEGWKESPGHRKNMLDPDVTETGVAVAQSEQTGYYYAVQMFGRPKSLSIEFQIANQADAEVRYAIGDQTFQLPPRYTRTHQRCRPADLTVRWPGDQEASTVRPGNGDRLTITRGDGGAFRIAKQ